MAAKPRPGFLQRLAAAESAVTATTFHRRLFADMPDDARAMREPLGPLALLTRVRNLD